MHSRLQQTILSQSGTDAQKLLGKLTKNKRFLALVTAV